MKVLRKIEKAGTSEGRRAMLRECLDELASLAGVCRNQKEILEAKVVEDCRNLLLAKFGKELQ